MRRFAFTIAILAAAADSLAGDAAWIWAENENRYGAEALAQDAWGKIDCSFPGTFLRFRNEFEAIEGEALKLKVSADERFVLFLNGREIVRGPQFGDVEHWKYVEVNPQIAERGGRMVLESVCWQLGNGAPLAQLSWRGGFYLKAEGRYDAVLSTGKGKWKVGKLANTRMTDKGDSGTFGVGSQCEIRGTSFLDEEPVRWREPVTVLDGVNRGETFGGVRGGWRLERETRAAPMMEFKTPGKFVNAPQAFDDFTIAANTERELIWDLGEYYTAYPMLEVSGGKGAVVTWGWTESPRDVHGNKGNRGEWRGKNFQRSLTDVFKCDGRKRALFTTPWWRAGRWCTIRVKTESDPLKVSQIGIVETRYPITATGSFECDDERLNALWKMCRRGIETCAQEIFVDCPYYEQQMYPGDVKVQALALTALTADDAAVKSALTMLANSQRGNGMIAMNYPSRGRQESTSYTIAWLTCFHDYLMYHRDREWLESMLPRIRFAFDSLKRFEDGDGKLRNLPGWNFVDSNMWDKDSVEKGVDYLYRMARADLSEIECAIDGKWSAKPRQCAMPPIPTDKCSTYYLHSWFEAWARNGQAEKIFTQLGPWYQMMDSGAKTPFETGSPESRSDCHGWCSSPMYHLVSSIAGIRPSAPFYEKVRIAPAPGKLRHLKVRSPHPDGLIELELEFDGAGGVKGAVVLPDKLSGEFEWRGKRIDLAPGKNAIKMV